MMSTERRFVKVLEIEAPINVGLWFYGRLKKYFPVKLVKTNIDECRIILVVYRYSGLSTRYTVIKFKIGDNFKKVLNMFWSEYKKLSREKGFYGWT